MPRVSPSAIPRNSEKVPRVTISGGNFKREIINAFSAPPPIPTTSVMTAAKAIGRWASRHKPPSTTADKPIIDPTERSMPPVIMIGVSTSASSPTSTLRRVISKAFAAERKLFPVMLKIRHSRTMIRSSTHSLLGKNRSRQGGVSCSALISDWRTVGFILKLPKGLLTADARG